MRATLLGALLATLLWLLACISCVGQVVTESPFSGDVEGDAATPLPKLAATPLPKLAATLFVVPAITNAQILPSTVMAERDRGSLITVTAARGEIEAASFVVRAAVDITGLSVVASDLVSDDGMVIPAENIDLRVVKRWYQAGRSIYDVSHMALTPELLLKDDSLVKVVESKNYLRLTTGEYAWISDPTLQDEMFLHSVAELPIRDSSELLPVNVPALTNTQFWITVEAPDDALPGRYKGELVLRDVSSGASMPLVLNLLPFALDPPMLTYSIYYRGKLSTEWPEGSVSSEYKSEAQLRQELSNMLRHGVTHPNVYQGSDATLLGKVLAIRSELGLENQPLYTIIGTGLSTDPIVLERLREKVRAITSLARLHGATDVYFYGVDEAQAEELVAQRAAWTAVHEAGGQVYGAGYTAARTPPGNFAMMGDIQDLLVSSGPLDLAEAALWHGAGHEIFSYANPQVGVEQPNTYRRNYGLRLWQNGYDGAMVYAYQHSFGDIWNDFDSDKFRDHNFTYPTINGVIDTVQWEGFREGVDDVRYLSTLIRLRGEALAAGSDTSLQDAWLANLKQSPLTDLDEVRAAMVAHILCLSGEGPCCGNAEIEPGEECDGLNHGGQSCADLGFVGGVLLCSASCEFNRCGCEPAHLAVSFGEATPGDGAQVASTQMQVNAAVESYCTSTAGFLDWDGSLMGYWNFNDGSAKDQSSHGRDATIHGASPADGRFGAALQFDGADDWIECGDALVPENGTATIEGWFRFDLMASETGSRNLLFNVLYQHPSNDNLYITATNDYFRTAALIEKEKWYHILFSYSGAVDSATLYVNGRSAALNIQGEVEEVPALTDFRIGGDAQGSFRGLIDEVRVWNRRLSPAEIQFSYDASSFGLVDTFAGLSEGTHSFYAVVVDAVGNVEATETRTVTVAPP